MDTLFLTVFGLLALQCSSNEALENRFNEISVLRPVAVRSKEICKTDSLNISDRCPFGYFCMNNVCQCPKMPGQVVKCDDGNSFSLLGCYCATSDWKKGSMEVGTCIWNCWSNFSEADVYHKIKKFSDYNMCEPWKRTGTLCGRCQPDHYPLAYSYSLACAKCHHTHWN